MGYFNIKRFEILPFIPSNTKSLLDIGCGEGAFGAMVKEKISDCVVWGIEPDFASSELAKIKLDFVINDTFEKGNHLLKNKFEIICFNDVLEHLVDPWSALRNAKDSLGENGRVVCSIPNILHFYAIKEILFTKDWKYTSKGILDQTHLRFFTRKSIIRLFEETGYQIETIEGINPVISRGAKLLSFLTAGYYEESKYAQFVVVAFPLK